MAVSSLVKATDARCFSSTYQQRDRQWGGRRRRRRRREEEEEEEEEGGSVISHLITWKNSWVTSRLRRSLRVSSLRDFPSSTIIFSSFLSFLFLQDFTLLHQTAKSARWDSSWWRSDSVRRREEQSLLKRVSHQQRWNHVAVGLELWTLGFTETEFKTMFLKETSENLQLCLWWLKQFFKDKTWSFPLCNTVTRS